MANKNNNQSKEAKKSFIRKNPSAMKIGFNSNTLFAVVFVILVVSLLFNVVQGFFSDTQNINVSEFIEKTNNNQYQSIDLRDDGTVLATTKSLASVNFEDGDTITTDLNDENTAHVNEDLETVDMNTLYDSIRPLGFSELLSAVTNPSEIKRATSIFLAEDYIIAKLVTGSGNDLYVPNSGETIFYEFLNSKGVHVNQLPIEINIVRTNASNITSDQFTEVFNNESFSKVWILENNILAEYKSEKVFKESVNWRVLDITSPQEFLAKEGIDLSSNTIIFTSTVIPTVPWGDIILIGMLVGIGFLIFFMFRGVQGSGNSLMKFGQSKAQMVFGKKPDVTFKDVAGVDEAKEELNEVVLFLKEPKRFLEIGARIPKGLLMVGQPGTGKTLLARAIAGEAGVPFFHTSGSEFEEMLVGAGASRVRDLFEKAKKASPSIIFIDEIDAVARKRGTTVQSSTTEQTLNQILVEMDGFEKNVNVIVIAATNRPDVLDPAILRPGRFDRRVVLDLPDIEGRKQIIAIHAKNKPISKDVDLDRLAKRTVGFSGADIENLLNESAIIVAKANRKSIEFNDLEEAANKVQIGPAKKRKRTKEELRKTAYHEAGHALVMKLSPEHDPVHRVTIISRGMALGYTMPLPEKDEVSMSKTKMLSKITALVAGFATERMIYNDVTSGASNDIEQATSLARRMVKSFGMSKKLGLVKYGQENELQYLGYGYGEQRDYSEESARLIDEEVRDIISTCLQQAEKIISENKNLLEKIVDTLIEKEVIDAEEFLAFFKEKPKA